MPGTGGGAAAAEGPAGRCGDMGKASSSSGLNCWAGLASRAASSASMVSRSVSSSVNRSRWRARMACSALGWPAVVARASSSRVWPCSAASIWARPAAQPRSLLLFAGGVVGVGGGQQLGEQAGAFGAEDPLIEELADRSKQVGFADGDGAGVVGDGGGVAGVGHDRAGTGEYAPAARTTPHIRRLHVRWRDRRPQLIVPPRQRVGRLPRLTGDGLAAVADSLGGVVQLPGDDRGMGGFG